MFDTAEVPQGLIRGPVFFNASIRELPYILFCARVENLYLDQGNKHKAC